MFANRLILLVSSNKEEWGDIGSIDIYFLVKTIDSYSTLFLYFINEANENHTLSFNKKFSIEGPDDS